MIPSLFLSVFLTKVHPPQTQRDFKHLYVFHNVTTIPLLIILNSSLPTQNNEEPLAVFYG